MQEVNLAESIVIDHSKKAVTDNQTRTLNAIDAIAFGGNQPHSSRRRGRGAGLNTSGRHEPVQRVEFNDGWDIHDEINPIKTEVQAEISKSVITRNQSPDIPFDRSINTYRGCEHGCVYCYARPTHANMGLSPGIDFESRLFAKKNVAAILERELSHPNYKPAPIAIGTNTDPYQPIERDEKLTRQVLEILDITNHPVTITTKSASVLTDIDLLASMAQRGLVRVIMSITSLDHKLSRAMEPRASTPTKRLEALKALSNRGVPVSVNIAPVIPAINDHEIERILTCAANSGIDSASYITLRLPREVSPIFKEWLLRHHPDKYRRTMGLIRSMRDGKDYDANWTQRMRGNGPYAWQLKRRFEIQTRKLGIYGRPEPLRNDLFKPPFGGGQQLSLL